MSYLSKDLSVLAYANGFTLWHYVTADKNITEMYFVNAHTMLRHDDVLIVNAELDTQFFRVKKSGSVVTVYPIGALPASSNSIQRLAEKLDDQFKDADDEAIAWAMEHRASLIQDVILEQTERVAVMFKQAFKNEFLKSAEKHAARLAAEFASQYFCERTE